MLAEQPKGDEEKPIQTHAMPGWGVGRRVGNAENLFRLASSGATFTSHGVHVEVWG